jgi:flagellar P-ring protein precursor FlgI
MKKENNMFKKIILISILLISILEAAKVKDISNIVGVRDNQLIGYGIVVGLNGTGDGGSLIKQNLANMLKSVNVNVSPNDLNPSNVASVIVTATLPPFAKQGDKLDITISSIGDAKSLANGTLLLTPLRGIDGNNYAVAQGPVTINALTSNDNVASQQSDLRVGNIYNGALVEREINHSIYNKTNATLSLKESNFLNALAIQKRINSVFKEPIAMAKDSRTIEVKKPEKMSMVEFLAEVQEVNITYKKKNKIIINEKTGTIIAGTDIRIEPVVINHNDMTIKISKVMALPFPDANNTELGDGTVLEDKGDDSDLIVTDSELPTIANITRALKKLGVTTSDLVSIITAMKQADAIRVDLEVI